MDKNVRVIYKKVTEKMKKNGYINLNHRLVNTKDDLIDIASIFRSPDFETFRIIYMKGKSIAGYESISSRTPIVVSLFHSKKRNVNSERGFYQIKERMKRLNADGYYMVHNHPSGSAKASSEDIHVTKEFMRKVDGFRGHLILGTDQYAWIDRDNKYLEDVIVDNEQDINFRKADKFSKMMKKKSIYDVQIASRTDLVNIVHHINNNKEYSTAILTDATNRIRMILDVPNSMINQNDEQLNGFFRNLGRLTGSTKVLFATTDEETFKRSVDHYNYGTFKDTILYKEIGNNKMELCEAPQIRVDRELFDKELNPIRNPLVDFGKLVLNKSGLAFESPNRVEYNFSDDNDDYITIPIKDNVIDLDKEDTFEPRKNEIKVLYKAVGKDPIVKVIPNTLEAKQKLVGGLIEVVPYDEETLLVCNDEGKIIGMKPNLCFDYDYIAGDCFLIGDDYENADFKSLTQEQINRAKEDWKRRSFNYKEIRKDCSKQIEKEQEL